MSDKKTQTAKTVTAKVAKTVTPKVVKTPKVKKIDPKVYATHAVSFDEKSNTYSAVDAYNTSLVTDLTGVAVNKLKYAVKHGGYIRSVETPSPDGTTSVKWRACIDPFKKTAVTENVVAA